MIYFAICALGIGCVIVGTVGWTATVNAIEDAEQINQEAAWVAASPLKSG